MLNVVKTKYGFNCLTRIILQVDIDFEKEPIGTSKDGKKVYFKDIWPLNEEIADVRYSLCVPYFYYY